MVGHTGVKAAAIKAVETVDTCVGQIVEAVKKMGGVILITADHGNADRIMKPDGSPDTAHTTNPVPLIVSGADVKLRPGRPVRSLPDDARSHGPLQARADDRREPDREVKSLLFVFL